MTLCVKDVLARVQAKLRRNNFMSDTVETKETR